MKYIIDWLRSQKSRKYLKFGIIFILLKFKCHTIFIKHMSRKLYACLTLAFLLIFPFKNSLLAQNTLVKGNIANTRVLKEIELQVNELYLNNESNVYSSNILEDGSFAFAVQINKPQLATLSYSQNKAVVYLEPNDTLYIYADVHSFDSSIGFAGRGGSNNTYLTSYFRKNPREMDPFKITKYRKGDYYYGVDPEKNSWMSTMIPPQFNQKIELRKANALAELDFHFANNPGKLSYEFKEFLTTEIYYEWAYNKLLYSDVYKNKYGLTDADTDFLIEIPLNNEMIGNYWYREFLKAYFNFQNRKFGNSTDPFAAQYDAAAEVLSDTPLYYFQSEMIVRAFRSKQPKYIISRYLEFVQKNPYDFFEEKVISVYNKVMRYSEGASAPGFTMKDINGNLVSLANYQGRPVYLNFWASWCRPCMKKMNDMKPYLPNLEREGVVFLNVSLDQNESTWKNTIASNNFSGVHIRAPKDYESDIIRNYEVTVLPQYFLIDKWGSFAQKPPSQDVSLINESLKRLTKN